MGQHCLRQQQARQGLASLTPSWSPKTAALDPGQARRNTQLLALAHDVSVRIDPSHPPFVVLCKKGCLFPLALSPKA